MKKKLALLLILCLSICLVLCACGREEAPTAAPEAAATPVEDAPETADFSELEQKAADLIGKDASKAYDAFGTADSEEYAPSCLGDGEDGVLTFGDVSVYTYRESGNEEITSVIINENGKEVCFPD